MNIASVRRTWSLSAVVLACFCGIVAAAPVEGPKAIAPGWRETVKTFAAGHFKHPAWGYSHSVRCYKLAGDLAAADKVKLDDDVMFAAAYLHDMGAFAPWTNTTQDHADISAKEFETVLKGTDFPMAKLEAVRQVILTHMFMRDPSGKEAVYMHDADALEWLGAVGAARMFAIVDTAGGAPAGPDMAKAVEYNLKTVPDHVFSPAGKALLPARKAELESFLNALNRETDNLGDL